MNEKRETSREKRKGSQPFLWLILVAICIFLLIQRFGFRFVGNVVIALLGLGLVIFIHELGHFILAKLTGMKVEGFSFGFPPTFLGIKRTEKGLRIRILPMFFRKRKERIDGQKADEQKQEIEEQEEVEEEGGLSFIFGRPGKAGETEYRLSLIPFGGYVKIFGQEDIGKVKYSDDPRSYPNKPVSFRMMAIGAGVFFNAILAVVLSIIVFSIGINLMPPIIGGVLPGSPAAKAGLKGGDEVLAVAGQSYNLEFNDVAMLVALSGKDKPVDLKVRHEDGSVEDYQIVPQESDNGMGPIRQLGIKSASTLKIARLRDDDAKRLASETGLKPDDRVVAVNGKEVKNHWQLEEIIINSFEPFLTLTAERIVKTKQEDGSISERKEFVKSREIRLSLSDGQKNPVEAGIYFLVPRMRIAGLSSLVAGPVQKGDIIVAVGGVCDPNYGQFRRIVEEYENQELPLTVDFIQKLPFL